MSKSIRKGKNNKKVAKKTTDSILFHILNTISKNSTEKSTTERPLQNSNSAININSKPQDLIQENPATKRKPADSIQENPTTKRKPAVSIPTPPKTTEEQFKKLAPTPWATKIYTNPDIEQDGTIQKQDGTIQKQDGTIQEGPTIAFFSTGSGNTIAIKHNNTQNTEEASAALIDAGQEAIIARKRKKKVRRWRKVYTIIKDNTRNKSNAYLSSAKRISQNVQNFLNGHRTDFYLTHQHSDHINLADKIFENDPKLTTDVKPGNMYYTSYKGGDTPIVKGLLPKFNKINKWFNNAQNIIERDPKDNNSNIKEVTENTDIVNKMGDKLKLTFGTSNRKVLLGNTFEYPSSMPNEEISFGRSKIYALTPQAWKKGNGTNPNGNETSLVVMLDYHGKKVLFPGDATTSVFKGYEDNTLNQKHVNGVLDKFPGLLNNLAISTAPHHNSAALEQTPSLLKLKGIETDATTGIESSSPAKPTGTKPSSLEEPTGTTPSSLAKPTIFNNFIYLLSTSRQRKNGKNLYNQEVKYESDMQNQKFNESQNNSSGFYAFSTRHLGLGKSYSVKFNNNTGLMELSDTDSTNSLLFSAQHAYDNESGREAILNTIKYSENKKKIFSMFDPERVSGSDINGPRWVPNEEQKDASNSIAQKYNELIDKWNAEYGDLGKYKIDTEYTVEYNGESRSGKSGDIKKLYKILRRNQKGFKLESENLASLQKVAPKLFGIKDASNLDFSNFQLEKKKTISREAENDDPDLILKAEKEKKHIRYAATLANMSLSPSPLISTYLQRKVEPVQKDSPSPPLKKRKI